MKKKNPLLALIMLKIMLCTGVAYGLGAKLRIAKILSLDANVNANKLYEYSKALTVPLHPLLVQVALEESKHFFARHTYVNEKKLSNLEELWQVVFKNIAGYSENSMFFDTDNPNLKNGIYNIGMQINGTAHHFAYDHLNRFYHDSFYRTEDPIRDWFSLYKFIVDQMYENKELKLTLEGHLRVLDENFCLPKAKKIKDKNKTRIKKWHFHSNGCLPAETGIL